MLITEIGKTNDVARAIGQLGFEDARVIDCSPVTGPYDIVVWLGAADINALSLAVVEIAAISDVKEHLSCLASPIPLQ